MPENQIAEEGTEEKPTICPHCKKRPVSKPKAPTCGSKACRDAEKIERIWAARGYPRQEADYYQERAYQPIRCILNATGYMRGRVRKHPHRSAA